MIGHAWDAYWSWVGGNIGAMPLEALIAAVVGVVSAVALRPFLRRLWAWLKHELSGAALEEAKAARRIAADLHEHLTGERHPAAPADSGSEAT